MRTLYYAGQPGEGFGWGVCNTYLRKELGKLFEIRFPIAGDISADPMFMPIADHELTPIRPLRGRYPYIGYCFFEYPLGESALENSKIYDWIFAGSSWCVEKLKERGIHHCSVLVQGVDHDIFKPEPRDADDKFRLFSGGKFEYRKGQDIVIAACEELFWEFPDMELLAAWYNPWPELAEDMQKRSPHLQVDASAGDHQERYFMELCVNNGLDRNRVFIMPKLTQPQLAHAMQQTDLGIFPNRCEGGTNLVLMEYMACGKPALVSMGSGHLEFADEEKCYPLHGGFDLNEWLEVPVKAIVETVKVAYHDKMGRCEIGEMGRRTMRRFTWARAAETIAEKIEELT